MQEIYSLKTEVEAVFSKALKNAFPLLTEEVCELNSFQEDGVFQCDNVMSIWSKIRDCDDYDGVEVPMDVGKKIKTEVEQIMQEENPSMIDGDPRVHGVGFVTIRIAGTWVAKQIYTMLTGGIDTWVPRQQLESKSTLVYSPSWDDSTLHPVDLLRRQCIIMSQMHLLECVKAAATTASGNGMSCPRNVLDAHFRTVGNGRYVYTRDGQKCLVRGKSRTPDLDTPDSERTAQHLGYPLEDLAAMWHALEKEKTDLMLCVTPTQQQGYVEECLRAAAHAGWTNDKPWPLASITYVGFRRSSTCLDELISFLDATSVHPSKTTDEAAELLGYTKEAVLDCALTYTFLKYNRLADFNFTEMLDIKGDSFVHLLLTLAQIREITDKEHENIDKLKASVLQLGPYNDLGCEGVQRELGIHLLMFTDCITVSSAGVYPHVLCGYLNDLSKKFTAFYETYVSLGFKENMRLLLCEATAIVMEKGFHLLGITKIPSIKVVTAARVLSYVAPLDPVPVIFPNIRTRFEVFSANLNVDRDPEFDIGEVFGAINVSDHYGLLPGGRLLDVGPPDVSLLYISANHMKYITNGGHLEIKDPSSPRSVAFSSKMNMDILLYATNEDKDDIFEVVNFNDRMDFSSFLDGEDETFATCHVISGIDGCIQLYYVLLRNGLDSTIKVNLHGFSNVCGEIEILASYVGLECGDVLVESFYKAVLFEGSIKDLKDGDALSLTRSILAVPDKGSLLIEARFEDLASGYVFSGSCKSEPLSSGNEFMLHISDIRSGRSLAATITCS